MPGPWTPLLCPLLLLLLHSPLFSPVLGVNQTFQGVDPVSGAELSCLQCPPGKYLRERCTAERQTVCEECPPGSFTALWNYISRCLRCAVCGRNMVETSRCSRDRDCDCQCKHGYYYKESAGMCVPWAECGMGQGVSAQGTPFMNTVCTPCANGTYSDQVSTESVCAPHTICSGANQKPVVKGNAWHDTVCATCREARFKEPVDILRPVLSSFFLHHSLSLRRLRHVIGKLPTANGRTINRRSVSGLDQDQLQTRLDQWLRDALPEQLRTLPLVLRESGAVYTADRLQHKLDRVKTTLDQVCPQSQTGPGENNNVNCNEVNDI